MCKFTKVTRIALTAFILAIGFASVAPCFVSEANAHGYGYGHSYGSGKGHGGYHGGGGTGSSRSGDRDHGDRIHCGAIVVGKGPACR